MILENGFFGDMAPIKSSFVLCFLDPQISIKNRKIQGLECRIDVVKPKFYSS